MFTAQVPSFLYRGVDAATGYESIADRSIYTQFVAVVEVLKHQPLNQAIFDGRNTNDSISTVFLWNENGAKPIESKIGVQKTLSNRPEILIQSRPESVRSNTVNASATPSLACIFGCLPGKA